MRYLLSLCLCMLAAEGLGQPADLVLRGGKIVTVDDKHPSAQAVAIVGDRIVALGSDEAIKNRIGDDTKVVELGGRLVIPGFIEGHGHFLGLGYARMMLDLSHAKTWAEIIELVEKAAKTAPAGSWIVGRGWHQEKWQRPPVPNVRGYPTHGRLSAATPKHPVVLTHASGHMSFANQRAMQLAGVTSASRAPTGGEILRDDQAKPIGVFRETAQSLITRARSRTQARQTGRQYRERLNKAIKLASDECLAKGVTSFQDAGSSFATIRFLRQMAERKELPLRLWVMVRESNSRLARDLARHRVVGAGNHFFTARAIKRSIDGALGPHGAWLLEPYEDLTSSAGLNTSSISSIRETARLARQHNYQLCVHAIGDRANRATLDIFEQALRGVSDGKSRRWRVEHAQHLHRDDIPRFGKLGVIASMQGIHCTSDAVYVIQRLGQRRSAEGAYAWRSLLDSGAKLINGTDTPVEDVDPLASFYASVTRRLKNGVAFFPEQRMTRGEALRSYTLDAAYAAFEEKVKGSLSVGKLADMVVLSHDIMTCPEEQIRQARVLKTIVAGRVVYAASE